MRFLCAALVLLVVGVSASDYIVAGNTVADIVAGMRDYGDMSLGICHEHLGYSSTNADRILLPGGVYTGMFFGFDVIRYFCDVISQIALHLIFGSCLIILLSWQCQDTSITLQSTAVQVTAVVRLTVTYRQHLCYHVRYR